jgi:hypothetical protein
MIFSSEYHFPGDFRPDIAIKVKIMGAVDLTSLGTLGA